MILAWVAVAYYYISIQKLPKKSQTSKLQDPMHELVATIRMSENVFLIVCSITNYISI